MTTHRGPFRFDGPLGKRGRQDQPTKPHTAAASEKQKGGFNGERTRTEARYEATRQSRSSLGQYSKLSKVMGGALAEYFYCIRDRYAHGRLNGLFMKIRSCDTHQDGRKQLQRGLATDAGRALLLLHNFQKGRKLGANVRQPFTVDLAKGRLTLPHFTPAIDHTFPKGAKMAGLQLLLLRVDLDTLCCALAVSEVKVFTDTDTACGDVVLEAPVPDGKGHLFALLFSCYCFMQGDTLKWTPRQETVLAFVGIDAKT